MTAAGYIVVGHDEKVPIKLHWTLFVAALAVGGWNPGAWLGFLVVVVAHEMGHALMVYRLGGQVCGFVVQGIGGYCDWYGPISPKGRAAIAWGGTLGQLGLLFLTLVWLQMYQPITPFVIGMIRVLTWTNVVIVGVNVLPLPPFDGHEAWKFFLYGRSHQPEVGHMPKHILRRTDSGYVPGTPEEQETTVSSRISDPDLAQRLLDSLIANPYKKDTH
ncbi:MAG: M50 family metallopeptidase [Myxococcales bacterium]|nr:M50 family metallopeptidase [Myxococcales bacterium]